MKKILFLSLALVSLNTGIAHAMKPEDDPSDNKAIVHFKRKIRVAREFFNRAELEVKEQSRLALKAIENIRYIRNSGMGDTVFFEDMYHAAMEDIAVRNTEVTNYYHRLEDVLAKMADESPILQKEVEDEIENFTVREEALTRLATTLGQRWVALGLE